MMCIFTLIVKGIILEPANIAAPEILFLLVFPAGAGRAAGSAGRSILVPPHQRGGTFSRDRLRRRPWTRPLSGGEYSIRPAGIDLGVIRVGR